MEPAPSRASPASEEPGAWARNVCQIVRALVAVPEREAILERILAEALAATGARKGFLLGPEAGGELGVISSLRADGQPIERPEDEFSHSLITLAYREDRTLLVSNALCDPRTMDEKSVKALALGAVLCLPLRLKGEVLGVLYVENDSSIPFQGEQLDRLQAFGDCAALALALGRSDEPASLGRLGKEGKGAFSAVLGNTPCILRVLSVARRVAPADVPMLLIGETGTGKELFARGIHLASARAQRSFVALNCGAIPPSLVESELFGHEAGAFTGAVGAHRGVFEQSEAGTLFLDEVEALPLPVQVSLLRVLETGEVRRVGSEKTIRVNVRVVAAANQELEQMVASGAFRQDLYYRLKGIRIDLPPLRERREDIPILVEHFLALFRKKHRKQVVALRPWTWQALMQYKYPGNVRELKHIVEHGVLLCQDERIWVEDLPPDLQDRHGEKAPGWQLPVPETHEGLKRAKQEVRMQIERLFVLRALQRTGGNVSEAARQTGMNRVQLQNLIASLTIDPQRLREAAEEELNG